MFHAPSTRTPLSKNVGKCGNKISKGKKYVIWKRVNKYLSTEVSKGDFITEPQFYKLAIDQQRLESGGF